MEEKFFTESNSDESIADQKFQHFLKKEKNVVVLSDVAKTFVHSSAEYDVQPLEHLSQAHFTKEIHSNLFKHGYRTIFPIQAYSFNEICTGRSVVIVNPKCSGKTMGMYTNITFQSYSIDYSLNSFFTINFDSSIGH